MSVKPIGYWTKERCHEEALKYKTRSEYQRLSGSSYVIANKNGWIDDICLHMVSPQKPNGYWNKERCAEEALKYNTRSEFQNNSSSARNSAMNNGWMDEICSHMISPQKPNGYWTKERCAEEALKYKTKVEFRENSGSAYSITKQKKWIIDICSHMIEIKKPNGYWTKEKCQEEALKYNSRKEFKKNSMTAYNVAIKNRWIYKITTHTNENSKPPNYWTKERVQEEALKYNTRTEFNDNSGGAYGSAQKKGWLNDVCLHMEEQIKPNGYWTLDKLKEEALKYKSRKEFRIHNSGAFTMAHRNGYIDEICSHMDILGNHLKRCIYAYEFDNNYVYIGLTYDIKKRNENHLSSTTSQIYKHIQNTNSTYNLIKITEFIDVQLASKLEGEYLQKYIENGWNILNKAKTGGVGGNNLMWTKETCYEEALKYKTKAEFGKNNTSAYSIACKRGWITDICGHMIEKRQISSKIYWTKERCHDEALKYNTRTEFTKNSGGAYSSAKKHKWLDEICSHMKKR